MSFLNDLKVLYHLLLRPVRGKDHAQRMENFYAGQAEHYDDFRKRLLQGRQEVYERLGQSHKGTWVDFGGGTGANLEFIGPAISKFENIYVVDLAESLLGVVQKRVSKKRLGECASRGGRCDPLEPTVGSSRCGDVFLLLDDDSRLVWRNRKCASNFASWGKHRSDRFLCCSQVPCPGASQAWLVQSDLLAGLVLRRQCVSKPRSSALPRAALQASVAFGKAGQGTLHALGPNPLLSVHWNQNVERLTARTG